ncbi:MAG: DNA polymerase III subunit gamma/tau [Flavipsychrobacter sp.]
MAENYIVSARKYRPQTFDTVVGQQHITTTLKNAIKNSHLAHAYLFCGPRGVGKTTCARILAKTINCEQPTEDMEACGTCATCKSFDNHTSFNIFELDAASNNSVDDIRELVSQVRFAPQSGKYKIYIIDEVHMLSASAFNAFLKTLEEPPSYAIFILATTEKHKILPTILSRCQIFDFKRITSGDITNHLHSIATKESVVAQEAALHVMAQKSEGCMRDALSMFDRIVSFTNGMLTYSSTMEHLNLLDADFYFKLLDLMLAQDVSGVMLAFDGALEKGFEGDVVLEGIAQHLRNLLLCRDARMAKLLDVPSEHKPIYYEKANQAPPSFIISALNIVNESELSYRNANNKRLHVEMCLIRMCYLLQTIEEGEKKNDKSSVIIPSSPPVQNKYTPSLSVPVAKTEISQPASPPKEVQQAPVIENSITKAEPPSGNQVNEKPVIANKPITSQEHDSTNKSRRVRRDIMAEIDDAVNNLSDSDEEERRELTQDLVERVFADYKEKAQKGNKSMLYAQLLMMTPEVKPPDEICFVVPTDLTNTYALNQRDELLEFFSNKTGIRIRITTDLRVDENIEQTQQEVVLSTPEILDVMIEKNPNLGKLKDNLNLQIEY